MAAFAAVVGAKCGLPQIQVMAILGGAFDAIAALEAESLVRVHTDIGVVCGVITGSFPTADAAFDPTRNALELALRLDDRLRLGLADATATIVTAADVTRGDGDGLVNATGTLEVTGENIETATEIQLLRDSGELWQRVPATYFEGALTAELNLPAPPSATGAVRVVTIGGSATYNVRYENH